MFPVEDVQSSQLCGAVTDNVFRYFLLEPGGIAKFHQTFSQPFLNYEKPAYVSSDMRAEVGVCLQTKGNEPS